MEETHYDSTGAATKTITFTYDEYGNILSRTENGQTIAYTYGTDTDAGWSKLLTAYNGQSIDYDAIGNPLSYRGATLTWTNGRNLASYAKDGVSISYTYDDTGMRTTKTVNGAKSEYLYVDGVLMGEIRDGHHIHYSYDSYGKLSVIKYYTNDTSYYIYYVMTNAQGDVISLHNANGATMVTYEYDAWGNLLSMTDTTGVGIGTINPFRYRGYYYDTETGLYYLASRYYDPEVGRFISADNNMSGIGTDLRGNNVYAYCFNNPANMADLTGNWPRWITATVAVTAAVVAVVATIAEAPVVAAVAATVAAVAAVAYIAQSHHYDKRAAKNDNDTLPKTLEQARKTPDFNDQIDAKCHQFTAKDGENIKVCWPDGREAIYDSHGDLVTHPNDVGTFNLYVPDQTGGKQDVLHGIFDVAPWIIFGNDDDDTTLMYQRVLSLF